MSSLNLVMSSLSLAKKEIIFNEDGPAVVEYDFVFVELGEDKCHIQ